MYHKAKTYRQFINEAYIDDSGDLQDFGFPGSGDIEYELYDHADRIREYLEESGAEYVKSRIDDGVMIFKFNYQGMVYSMGIDMDSGEAQVVDISARSPIVVYQDSTDSLFDLLSQTGLDFLGYH